MPKFLFTTYLVLSFALFPADLVFSQDIEILKINELLELVDKNHPVSLRIDLIEADLKARQMIANGLFDPVLFYSKFQKEYEEKKYYAIENAEFKLPTWVGIDIYAQYERNNGDFLNPQGSLPNEGLFNFGLSMNVFSGLWNDARRNAVRKADNLLQSSEYRQVIAKSELHFKSLSTYWKWAYESATLDLINDAAMFAEERFSFVKSSYQYGASAAMDTLEAQIIFRQRQFQQEQAKYNRAAAGLELNNYIWLDNLQPSGIKEDVGYEPLETEQDIAFFVEDLESKLNELTETHPLLQIGNLDLENLKLDEALRQVELLPNVDVKYNFLSNIFGDNENVLLANPNNYKFGVEFKLPILLRKERGSLAQAKVRVQEAEFNLAGLKYSIFNSLSEAFVEIDALNNQTKILRENAIDFKRLLDLEWERFKAGESSLFLVNNREMQYLDANMRYLKLLADFRIAIAAFYRDAGLLYPY